MAAKYRPIKPVSSPRRDPGDHKYCIECYYPLKGLASPGKCPECGCSFDLADMYSYSIDPKPPKVTQRTVARRIAALLVAVALVAFLPFFPQWACAMLLLYPLWQFTIVWLCFSALGLHRLEDSLGGYLLAGSVIGLLSLLPLGFSSMLLMGAFGGAVCGFCMMHLKATGWID